MKFFHGYHFLHAHDARRITVRTRLIILSLLNTTMVLACVMYALLYQHGSSLSVLSEGGHFLVDALLAIIAIFILHDHHKRLFVRVVAVMMLVAASSYIYAIFTRILHQSIPEFAPMSGFGVASLLANFFSFRVLYGVRNIGEGHLKGLWMCQLNDMGISAMTLSAAGLTYLVPHYGWDVAASSLITAMLIFSAIVTLRTGDAHNH